METLRQQHDNIEYETSLRFSALLNNFEQDITLAADDENYDDCELVEVYNEVNGGIYSVYVVGITKGGMIKGRDLDGGAKGDYRFSELASVLDRINIVEILEANQNN